MISTQPLFTVATITYNSGKWVRQAIESVLASTFTDFEYLISDDNSADDTWAIIQQYNDPRIRAWRNESNKGEYPNRNTVLKKARGSYILYIDGDDILYKGTLRNLSEYIFAFPGVGMVWGVPHYDFIVFPVVFSPAQIFKIEFLGNYHWSMIGFPETVFKTALLLQSGGFSEEYAIGDYYIKKKLALYAKVLLIPIGNAYWRIRKGQASQNTGNNYRSLLERYEIDSSILNDNNFPLSSEENAIARERLLRASAIQVFTNTISKGKIADFFMLRKKMRLRYYDFLKMFRKVKSISKLGRSGENPLVTDYNFIKGPSV